jgi:hypothetical protein
MVNRTGGRSEKLSLNNFSGGLNNVNDLSTMADNELAILDNLEVDSNGSLAARPPIVKIGSTPVNGAKVDILGFYTLNGTTYIICAVGSSGTYRYDPAANTWLLITSIVGSGCAQYQDKLFICSLTTSGGFYNGTTFTVLNAAYYAANGAYKKMPMGSQIILYKERFFMISAESTMQPNGRILYSNINDLTNGTEIYDWDVWSGGPPELPAENYFNVSAGDGQTITALVSGADEIFIFRSRSTYYFKYSNDIYVDSYLQQIDANIGADNRHCVVKYEFSYLVLSNGKFYRFVSYLFYPLNEQAKLELRPDTLSGIDITSSVSVFGRRAVIWYGAKIYTVDLEGGTWSTWSSVHAPAYFKLAPRSSGDLSGDIAYGVTGITGGVYGIYRVRESLNGVDSETMTHTMQTKAHDFGQAASWKRMYYWTADVYTSNNVTGVATPIQFISSSPSWDSMAQVTWDELDANTWDIPTEPGSDVTTVVQYTSATAYRVNVTFQKGMRFRRCAFKVMTTSDGTTGEGPVRISAVTVHAALKQSLPQIIQ